MIPPALLLQAYGTGWFPMSVDGEIRWYSPDPRAILPLERFHVPARLARVIRQQRFTVRVNGDFRRVIQACADRGEESWIDGAIVESYTALHRLGFAHSVEAWQGDRLAGGLYGVSLGGAFFGESMFHDVSEASKVALHGLVERLRARRYRLLDVQWVTPHLRTFGAVEISRRQYLARLRQSLKVNCDFV